MSASTPLRPVAERDVAEADLQEASDAVLALQETDSEYEDVQAHSGSPVQSTPSLAGC